LIPAAQAAAETANSTAKPPPDAGLFQFGLIAVMAAVFYFFLIRPQSKRAKEHKELLGGLAKGDEVVTSGGILGKVNKVVDDFVVVEIANNLEIKVQKQSVTATLPKGTLKNI
jgi:preprotein translocase subunit YajC